ncbi:MAG TPA: TrbG/VirB9 family P-type conjugative transfer protein [Steroidobacteraceae bacterium]|nr:TrbG/VirB9 family P-type conjugative transfer protein [Steroidobacteraceae bacterium]
MNPAHHRHKNRSHGSPRRPEAAGAPCLAVAAALLSTTPPLSASDPVDNRIRALVYDVDEVYRLKGYSGYQIDLEFEAGETFVGLGTGDLDSLTFASQDNHLFLKPRAGGADTNLTVLTTRRTYHFDYSSSERRPDPAAGDVVYVLRFVYAPQRSAGMAAAVEHELAGASQARPHNLSYGYRGSAALKPASVWDDGVQTRLRFDSHEELPAIFVRNEDGTESLLNFSVDAGELTVHRVARQFAVRRGNLHGCIINQDYSGSGQRLESGTVAPDVQRSTRQLPP